MRNWICSSARRTLATIVLLVAAAGCQDLAVSNPNAPDRTRALTNPADVQSLIASSFTSWWAVAQGTLPGFPFTTMADEFSSGFADYGILAASSEPRIAYNNSTANSRRFQNEVPWYELYGALSNVNDAMGAIDRGVRIVEDGEDVTERARAFGRFMQGLIHGYIALFYDRGYIVDERASSADLAEPQLRPYAEVRDSALAYLDEAITLSTSTSFTLPAAGWISGLEVDNLELARLARTFQARFLVYSARTPAERQDVAWERVNTLIEGAITTDFAPQGIPGVVITDMRRVVARERPGRAPGDFARVDYFLVGPSDTTGRFQAWVASPLSERVPFQVETADRRVHAAQDPSSPGRYIAYDPSTIFALDRGVYHRSYYWYHRLGRGNSYQEGPQLAITRTELELLQAEGYIRRGMPGAAVPLINQSRVANGELPAVDVDGPPQSPSCVPRKVHSTSCGSLWDALRWEKRIEGLGVDPNVAFFDARGWGTLVEGTPVHMPIPAREIETLALPSYTFGGGGVGSSAPPNHDGCPLPLARCE